MNIININEENGERPIQTVLPRDKLPQGRNLLPHSACSAGPRPKDSRHLAHLRSVKLICIYFALA